MTGLEKVTFKTGDCLIEVTTKTGLTVYSLFKIYLLLLFLYVLL
jgi:hypothetical protein